MTQPDIPEATQRRTTGAPAEPRRRRANAGAPVLRLEHFVLDQFRKMPAGIRIAVYLLLVFVYVFNVLQDPVLMGIVRIQDTPTDDVVAAPGIALQAGVDQEFVTNVKGRWVLRAPHRLLPLGRVDVELLNAGNSTIASQLHLGTAQLCLPMPIVSSFTGRAGGQFVVTYTRSTRNLTVAPSCGTGNLAHAAVVSSPGRATQRAAALHVDIERILLQGTGHRASPAEVYFVVKLAGQPLATPHLPAKQRPSSLLLLLDGQATIVRSLGFDVTASASTDVRIEVWDRDSGMLSRDDLLAEFRLPTGTTTYTGELTPVRPASNGSRLSVRVGPLRMMPTRAVSAASPPGA
jgi:hypothetical protein